jgi:hypothetical protein
MKRQVHGMTFTVLALILLLAVFGAAGCDSSSDDNPADGDMDGDVDGDTDGDISDGDQTDGDMADIRVIHLSPDAGAVDVYALGAVKAIENLSFGNSTDYLSLDPGTYSFQVVPTGGEVSSPALEVNDVDLMADKSYTAAAYGMADNLTALLLVDDNSSTPEGMLRVRAIHTADGVGEVDIWNIPAEGDPTLLYEDFAYGDVGDYLQLPAGSYSIGIDVDNDASPDLIVNTPALSAGLVINLFAIKDGELVKVIAQLPDGTTVPLMANPVGGDTASIRAMHLSPDAPVVDVYLDGETKAFSGLAFGQSSDYADVPAGMHDIDIVGTAGTIEDDGILSVAGLDLMTDKSYTALVYNLAASAQAVLLEDDYSDLTAGKIRVRAFHGAADVGAVDVWVVDTSDDSSFKVYDDLAFGSAGAYNGDLDTGTYTIALDLDNDEAGDLLFDLPEIAEGTVATLLAVKDGADVKLVILTEDGVAGIITGMPPLPEMADVRFIHLAPSTGAVDVYAEQSVKLAENLAYQDGTDYASVAGGTYDIDIVATGAADFVGSVMASVDLTAGMSYTGVAYDDGGAPAILALVDDTSAPAAGNFRVRAIHAADGVGEVDIWNITDINSPSPLFADLPFGDASAAAEIPAGTYTIGFDVDNNATPDLIFELPELAEGANINLFAVNDTTDGVVLLAQFADGTVSDPLLPSELTFIRVLHLSRTTGPVDIYVNESETPALEDVDFRDGTGYVPLPAGTYTFDIAPANMTLGDSVLTLSDLELEDGTFYSAVAYNVDSDGESISGMLITDDVSMTDEGSVRLRVFHTAYDVGLVDLWNLTDLGSPAALLTDFDFGDDSGSLDAPTAAYRLGLDVTGDGYAEYIFEFPELASGTIANVFAVTDDEDPMGVYLVAQLRDGSIVEAMGIMKAFLRVLHATPTGPMVDVWADGSVMLADDLSFGEGTDFFGVESGEYTINITPSDSTTSIKDFAGVALQTGRTYTAYAYGDVSDLADFKLGLVEDSFAGLFPGDVRVRPIHAAFGVGTVDIWDTSTFESEYVLYQNVPYEAVGSYSDLDAGSYTLTFDVSPQDIILDYDATFPVSDIAAGTIVSLFAVNDGGVKLLAAFQDGSVVLLSQPAK